MPNLYIISGCNGAGKTTASFTVLPEMLDCREFVNADEIARGLSPFQPEKVAVEAGRIMLQRIDELLKKQEDFAIETTLATRSYVQTIKVAKGKGYNITLVYFWLNSPELAIARVKRRVTEGGHNIPEEVIRRRYKKGIYNLFKLFIPICDYWIVIDNSQNPYIVVAEGQEDQEINIQNEQIWNKLKTLSNE
ncbi:AAA family ATPase [Rhodocytophaga rosea]|uniref:AAA family ATPase n=1 Tax=Rhodocytophaga rosea TaxID=2704465 RepID=A0A6C0GIU8_9BACT|nr:zeta toxin family protein [Rhodocytophaga rosea]QHT67956.1 AAA family ATPase [Rhodocytophaga rosea]